MTQVKPLEWVQHELRKNVHVAMIVDLNFMYKIYETDVRGFVLYLPTGQEDFTTLDAAKARAFNDWTARLRSVLIECIHTPVVRELPFHTASRVECSLCGSLGPFTAQRA